MVKNNSYTIIFIIILCVISSIILTLVSKGFEGKKNFNIELDRKKNVLKAFGFNLNNKNQNSIVKLFDNSIKKIVIDKEGNVFKGENKSDIASDKKHNLLIIYKAIENKQVKGYAIPIDGFGLWSQLLGYYALANDLSTVKGITFYKHGETPGLGGEIESDDFQKNFTNKKIFDSKNILRPTIVVKGKVDDVITDKSEHIFYVDGISGATMTCDGINQLLKNGLEKYEPFFRRMRKEFDINE